MEAMRFNSTVLAATSFSNARRWLSTRSRAWTRAAMRAITSANSTMSGGGGDWRVLQIAPEHLDQQDGGGDERGGGQRHQAMPGRPGRSGVGRKGQVTGTGVQRYCSPA